MKRIEISATVNGRLNDVWNAWNDPKHIVQWYFASDDWHCPSAENDVKVNGKFSFRMEAKNDQQGFDFHGHYIQVVPTTLLEMELGDGRLLSVRFLDEGNGSTLISESFEPASENLEMERSGWQAILNNFKRHFESANHRSSP